MKKLKLKEILEGIEDNRRKNSVMYPLYEVLFIMIIAIMCGATSYVKIEMFGKSRQEWFAKYLKLENGNYIFKANSGKAVNNVNYLFTKGDGIKHFLTEGDVTIKAARLTLGADHGEIIEDKKDTLFEIGPVYINNKIVLEPSSYSYCDGTMYYAYGQVGLVMTNGCDAEGIEHF